MSVLRKGFGRAEGDEPEEEPQRADSRKGEKGAVDNGISRAQKEEQVESRKSVHGGENAERDEERATENGREFHTVQYVKKRGAYAPRNFFSSFRPV